MPDHSSHGVFLPEVKDKAQATAPSGRIKDQHPPQSQTEPGRRRKAAGVIVDEKSLSTAAPFACKPRQSDDSSTEA
jgi:hypothetical protein